MPFRGQAALFGGRSTRLECAVARLGAAGCPPHARPCCERRPVARQQPTPHTLTNPLTKGHSELHSALHVRGSADGTVGSGGAGGSLPLYVAGEDEGTAAGTPLLVPGDSSLMVPCHSVGLQPCDLVLHRRPNSRLARVIDSWGLCLSNANGACWPPQDWSL